MKLLLTLGLLATVAVAQPARVNYPAGDVSILKYDYDYTGRSNYRYAFEQTDGTKAEQHGQFRNEGTNEESLDVSGSFQWIGPDGVTYTVTYTADQDGYKPVYEQGPGGALPAHLIHTALG